MAKNLERSDEKTTEEINNFTVNNSSDNLFPNLIKNQIIAELILEGNESIFSNNSIFAIEGSILYTNRDIITVYENNSKESPHFTTNHESVFLIHMEESPGWYYLISDDYEVQGFIYIYDISIKSFYGNPEANRRSGNYYINLLNAEYEIISRHNIFQRRGPILTINHNGNITNFIDTFYGRPDGVKYLVMDSYIEHNEILILEQYWEGTNMFVFNLISGKYSCERISKPYFNNSRNYMISLSYSESLMDATEYSLQIFRIDNGVFDKIQNERINIHSSWSLNSIDWINNHEVTIDYGAAGNINITIGDNITFSYNLVHILNWWGNKN